MSTPEKRKQIYKDCRANVGLNKRQWGRIFALGLLKNTDQVVSHKENPASPRTNSTSKGVNKAEALAAQLLQFFNEQGYDLKAIEFDDEGRIINFPKK